MLINYSNPELKASDSHIHSQVEQAVGGLRSLTPMQQLNVSYCLGNSSRIQGEYCESIGRLTILGADGSSPDNRIGNIVTAANGSWSEISFERLMYWPNNYAWRDIMVY